MTHAWYVLVHLGLLLLNFLFELVLFHLGCQADKADRCHTIALQVYHDATPCLADQIFYR